MKWPAVKDLHGDQIVTEGSVRATGAGPGRTGRRQNAKPAGRSAMILAIPAALLVLALIVAPQLWITSVMKRHGSQRPAIPWTGGEFARVLLDGMKLTSVKGEQTVGGDHYHPLAKPVRLKTGHYFGRASAAVLQG